MPKKRMKDMQNRTKTRPEFLAKTTGNAALCWEGQFAHGY